MKHYKFLTLIALLIWAGVTESCKKEETKKDSVITWATPADITYGTLLSATQLNATADIPGTFVYTPAIGTKLNAGANQDLKVDFTPTDAANNNTATKTVKINVIANATNGKTTAVFKSGITYGTLTDQDGNDYKTVTIGTQTWMAENLRTTKYNDGTSIPNITGASEWANLTTGAYCNYNNTTNIDTIATYGRLYNLYAVRTGKIAPQGWHVPSRDEYMILINYLVANGYNNDGSTTGNTNAKALVSAKGWYIAGPEHNPDDYITPGSIENPDYPEKRNATGFTALPGGTRFSDGRFNYFGYEGLWWTSTVDAPKYNNCSVLNSSSTVLGLYIIGSTNDGPSVRCIKD